MRIGHNPAGTYAGPLRIVITHGGGTDAFGKPVRASNLSGPGRRRRRRLWPWGDASSDADLQDLGISAGTPSSPTVDQRLTSALALGQQLIESSKAVDSWFSGQRSTPSGAASPLVYRPPSAGELAAQAEAAAAAQQQMIMEVALGLAALVAAGGAIFYLTRR